MSSAPSSAGSSSSGRNTHLLRRQHGLLPGALRRSQPPARPVSDQGRQLVCYKTGFDPIAARVADAHLLVTNNFQHRRPATLKPSSSAAPIRTGSSRRARSGPPTPSRGPTCRSSPAPAGRSATPPPSVVGYEWDNRDPGPRRPPPTRARPPPGGSAPRRSRSCSTAPSRRAPTARPASPRRPISRHPPAPRSSTPPASGGPGGSGKDGYANPPFQRFNENLVRALERRASGFRDSSGLTGPQRQASHAERRTLALSAGRQLAVDRRHDQLRRPFVHGQHVRHDRADQTDAP